MLKLFDIPSSYLQACYFIKKILEFLLGIERPYNSALTSVCDSKTIKITERINKLKGTIWYNSVTGKLVSP